MQIFSLLAGESFSLLQEGFTVVGSWLSWLTELIRILIEGVGITGVGIILFTLILKAVTLPFDIYQRVTMRKQTLIMRNMKPELDKLQKQYANDKSLYSQKMMELYKKNGYSMFSSCLPMILSMLILIFAFQSLNEFSQAANLAMYERMTASYNAAVLEYNVDESAIEADPTLGVISTEDRGQDKGVYKVVKGTGDKHFLYYEYNTTETNPSRAYKVDTAKMTAYFATVEGDPLTAYYNAKKTKNDAYTMERACVDYLSQEIGGVAAAKSYHDNPPSFLWIQNIWYADVSYAHPIQDYQSFINSIGSDIQIDGKNVGKIGNIIKEDIYNNITSHLNVEKEQPNGFFILIVLSIGLMVLSQFVSMKSNQEANQYQTVDGSGVNQQKMMMIMMPLIYAIFAFMYSAAFSIYMTMSSVISILVTLLSNVVLDIIFKKKEDEAFRKQHTREMPWKKNNDKKNKK